MNVPGLVLRAEALAEAAGLERPLAVEAGVLLHALAARRGIARAGGAGAVVGAAWIVSALAPGTPFVAVAPDLQRAALARAAFAEDAAVRVLEGDWPTVLRKEAPFDLLLLDAALVGDDPGETTGLLAPGGTAVVPGLAAGRKAWLAPTDLAAVVLAAGGTEALVATRVR